MEILEKQQGIVCVCVFKCVLANQRTHRGRLVFDLRRIFEGPNVSYRDTINVTISYIMIDMASEYNLYGSIYDRHQDVYITEFNNSTSGAIL